MEDGFIYSRWRHGGWYVENVRARMSDYSYPAFCAALAARDGQACRVAEILRARRPAVSGGLLACDGIGLDGHHLIAKARIRAAFRTALRKMEPGLSFRPLAEVLEDPRNGLGCCRRHHDLLENCRVRLYRDDLPDGIEDFAAELGLTYWLDRDYPLDGASRGTV